MAALIDSGNYVASSRHMVRPVGGLECARAQSLPHNAVRVVDERRERGRVGLLPGPHLYMAHALARAFENSSGIVVPGAEKKPDVDVCRERIDVAESSIADAGRGMTVVQELADIVAELAHEVESGPCHAAEVGRLRLEPAIDGRVVFDSALEPQQSDRRIVHTYRVERA